MKNEHEVKIKVSIVALERGKAVGHGGIMSEILTNIE